MTYVRSGAVFSPGLDRRSFLSQAAALPALAVIGSSFLPRRARAQASPKKGGTLRIGCSNGATTDTLDTALYITAHSQLIGFNVRNALFEIAADNKLKGELVEEWDVTENASRWKFKLRRGVEFHDGKTFDASDVIATLNHHRKQGSPSPMRDYLSGISRLEAPSPDTVLLELAKGDADLPYMLTDYHMGIAPADKQGNPDFLSGNGTGGYTLKSFQPGVSSSHDRFGNYWKEGAAHFDACEVQIIADTTARTGALISGEADAIDEIDLKTMALLQANPQIKIDEVVSGKHATMPMMSDIDPFKDVNVRMALKYAFNRKQLVDTVLNGHGLIGNDNPIAPNIPFYREFDQREQDPDKARYYLKQAGLESLDISLSTAEIAYAGAIDAALVFAEACKSSKINVQVVEEPSDGYWGNVWSKKSFVMSSWTARPTPGMLFSLAYAPNAAWNESHLKNEQFGKMLAEARILTDDGRRAELYGDMQQILRDDGATIVPFFLNDVSARSDKVAHADQMAAHLQLDGMKAMERWWFA